MALTREATMKSAEQGRPRRDDGATGGWWASIEQDVLTSLDARSASPAEIATSIGVSEGAVCSVIAMLVEEGKVRISRVELA